MTPNSDSHEFVVWTILSLFLWGLVRRLYVQRGRERWKRSARATGTVVNLEMRGSAAEVMVPSPDVEFVDGSGTKHVFQSKYGISWGRRVWPIGSKVAVHYDPHDPSDCDISSDTTDFIYAMIIGGCILAAAATTVAAVRAALAL
jgi:hypothetical protein